MQKLSDELDAIEAEVASPKAAAVPTLSIRDRILSGEPFSGKEFHKEAKLLRDEGHEFECLQWLVSGSAWIKEKFFVFDSTSSYRVVPQGFQPGESIIADDRIVSATHSAVARFTAGKPNQPKLKDDRVGPQGFQPGELQKIMESVDPPKPATTTQSIRDRIIGEQGPNDIDGNEIKVGLNYRVLSTGRETGPITSIGEINAFVGHKGYAAKTLRLVPAAEPKLVPPILDLRLRGVVAHVSADFVVVVYDVEGDIMEQSYNRNDFSETPEQSEIVETHWEMRVVEKHHQDDVGSLPDPTERRMCGNDEF